MHFVFTAPRFHTNQRFAFKALRDAGHEVSVLVLRRGGSEAYDVLEPHVLGCSRIFGALRRVAALLPGVSWSDVGGIPPVLRFWRELRRLKPDVVVVRSPEGAFGLLAILSARLAGLRIVLYVQAPRHRETGSLSRIKRSIVLHVSGGAWFTPVLGDRRRFPRPFRPPEYMPFVMEPRTSPNAKRWFNGGSVNLLHVGKFQPRKNHRMFLEALASLLSRYPLRATIIGECSTREQQMECEEVVRIRSRLGLDEVVEIETNVPHAEMGKRYACHDLFVLASCDEPAAVSHLEAMAHSLPVVCSDGNGTSCYIRHGENGYVFRSGDRSSLEGRMEDLVKDRERLVEMGRRSHEIVSTEHTPGRYVEALVAMAGGVR